MVPRSSKDPARLLAYGELASQPLPGPAVVIDVRHTKSYDPPLVQYLMTEVEDLTTQMRLHQVPRWRFLSKCIEFITLDIPPDKTVDNAPQFTLTRGSEEKTFLTRDALINHLHREYVDLVRTNRISAAIDTNHSMKRLSTTEVELEQSTVRVFFLLIWPIQVRSPVLQCMQPYYGKRVTSIVTLYALGMMHVSALLLSASTLIVSTFLNRRANTISMMLVIPQSITVVQDHSGSAPPDLDAGQQQEALTTQISTAFDMFIPIYLLPRR